MYIVMDILSTWRLNNSMIKFFFCKTNSWIILKNHLINDFLIIRSSITVRLSIDEELKNRNIEIAKISYRCTLFIGELLCFYSFMTARRIVRCRIKSCPPLLKRIMIAIVRVYSYCKFACIYYTIRKIRSLKPCSHFKTCMPTERDRLES